jgi:DNA-binding CsgD family transcriptional regulator
MEHTRADGQWLDLVGELLARPLTALPAERIALQLAETFGVRGTSFELREPGRAPTLRLWPTGEQFGGHRAEIEQWGPQHAAQLHPVLRYYLATGDAVPMQVTDVPERFAGRRVVGAWNETARPWGCAAQLALPLHLGAHSHLAFVLGRAEPFGPAEMLLARRVHRLLVGLDRQVHALAGAAVPPGPGVAESLRLTPRELAVLELVADGLTSNAIARRLLIAERTVHKHLERVYAKLGVTDRLSAVLTAQRTGVLPAPAERRRAS